MAIVANTLKKHYLKLINLYFEKNPSETVYPGHFYHPSTDVMAFLQENGYKCTVLADGGTQVSKL